PGRSCVCARLVRRLGAGDNRRDVFEVEDPAQRELCERGARRQQRAELLDGFEAGLEVHPGERLADVERLAVTVEATVVVCAETRVPSELPRQETGRERDPRDDADVVLESLTEEELRRPLAKGVEDDLHRGDARIF